MQRIADFATTRLAESLFPDGGPGVSEAGQNREEEEWPEAIVQLKTAAAAERHPYPNTAQPLFVVDLQSFAWCYLALAQQRSGLGADARESFERARGLWAWREDQSRRKFDAIASEPSAGKVSPGSYFDMPCRSEAKPLLVRGF